MQLTTGTKIGLGVIGAALLFLLIGIIWLVSSYNGFVDLEEQVNQKWSQVEVQYQRRADLIPNLVNTVKAAAEHERELFTEIAALRSQVGSMKADESLLDDPEKFQAYLEKQDQLQGALSRLMVVVENYPDLKANENFLTLQAQLEGTENRIAVERRRFNLAVEEYNAAVKRLPGAIVAGMFGFDERDYTKAETGAETAPDVNFE